MKKMSDGWFDSGMPDINQGNPYMTNFLTQNMIWYVQEFGIDGVRIDTYTYSDLEFANRCNQAFMDEYSNITLFGETRVYGSANQAYFPSWICYTKAICRTQLISSVVLRNHSGFNTILRLDGRSK